MRDSWLASRWTCHESAGFINIDRSRAASFAKFCQLSQLGTFDELDIPVFVWQRNALIIQSYLKPDQVWVICWNAMRYICMIVYERPLMTKEIKWSYLRLTMILFNSCVQFGIFTPKNYRKFATPLCKWTFSVTSRLPLDEGELRGHVQTCRPSPKTQTAPLEWIQPLHLCPPWLISAPPSFSWRRCPSCLQIWTSAGWSRGPANTGAWTPTAATSATASTATCWCPTAPVEVSMSHTVNWSK